MLSNDKEFSKKNHELFCDFQKKHYLCTRKKEIAEIAQLVEHNLAKVGVASSSLVFRSTKIQIYLDFFVLWSLPYYLLPMKSKIMEMITNVRSASFDFKFFSLKINAPHKNDTITEPRRIMETMLIMAPSRLSE